MKKMSLISRIFVCLFLGIILGLIILQNICFAQENVSFVYINGSNNNDVKMRNWYINGVNKLHPVMKKKFEKNKIILRRVYPEVPPKVEYRLTRHGESLRPIITAVKQWGETHLMIQDEPDSLTKEEV